MHDLVEQRVTHDVAGCRRLTSASAVLKFRQPDTQRIDERLLPCLIEFPGKRKEGRVFRLQIESRPLRQPMIVIRNRIDLRHGVLPRLVQDKKQASVQSAHFAPRSVNYRELTAGRAASSLSLSGLRYNRYSLMPTLSTRDT